MERVNLQRLRSAVAEVLEGFPEIRLVYLYGSQVSGNVGPMSDVDLGVLVGRDAVCTDVLSAFASAVARTLRNVSVDCVPLNRAAPELSFAVISTGVVLHEQSMAARVAYEAGVLSRYFDYLPVLRAMRGDILEDRNRVTRVQRYREAFERTERTLGEIRARHVIRDELQSSGALFR